MFTLTATSQAHAVLCDDVCAVTNQKHSVLTICTQTGTCDIRSGDLVFFSAAFDEFSVFTKK